MKRIFFVSCLLMGCASLKNPFAMSEEELKKQAHYQAQQQELSEVQSLADKNDNEKALAELLKFRKKYPDSPLFQASRLIEARAQYNMGNYEEALDIHQSIINLGPDKYPELWAQARYESTFSYEALGDQERVLTTLVGLEQSQAKLSEEVRLAELPARLAAIYSEMGREKESLAYLDKADSGLKFLLNKKGINESKTWLAETLFRMGIATTQHMTKENYSQIVRAQRRNQLYLIKSMEQNDPTWSQRSEDNLIQSYRELWNFTQIHWNAPEDRWVRNDKQKELHQLLSESLYRKPAENQLWNDHLKKYYEFAEDLDKRLSAALFTAEPSMQMTKESLELNDVKRPGRVEATKLLPEEKKKRRSKLNKKDPNL